jgi:hypothetical protein
VAQQKRAAKAKKAVAATAFWPTKKSQCSLLLTKKKEKKENADRGQQKRGSRESAPTVGRTIQQVRRRA